MTAKCIKNEMKKALSSRAALITYLLSFSLVIYHTVTKAEIYYAFYTAYQTGEVQGNPMITAVSLYCNWLGADVPSFAASAFFLPVPDHCSHAIWLVHGRRDQERIYQKYHKQDTAQSIFLLQVSCRFCIRRAGGHDSASVKFSSDGIGLACPAYGKHLSLWGDRGEKHVG